MAVAVLVTDVVFDSYDATKTAGELSAVAGVAAFFNTIISLMYLDLANDYYKLYKKQRDFYYNTFQQQGEAPFTNEQFGIAPYNPDYIGVFHSGYLPPGILLYFNPQIALRLFYLQPSWQRKADMYNSALDNSQSYAVDTALIADDWFSYMFRYEEHKRDVLNERRWAGQMDGLSFGVKQAAAAERGLATSFGIFDEAQGQLLSNINSVGNGLATYLGRKDTMNELTYPVSTLPAQQSNYDTIFQSNMGG